MTTAQNNITELRIALNQLREADSTDKLAQHYQNVACIMQALQFDIEDIKEDKLAELEKMDYVPSF